MLVWIDRILLGALMIVVLLLSATSLPFLVGESLGGSLLLVHMLASGAMVIGMPILAITLLRHAFTETNWLQQLGYVATLATALVTIATVFLCMLPVASTGQMHELMSIHGWAGFAMIPAVAVLLLGMRGRKSVGAAP